MAVRMCTGSIARLSDGQVDISGHKRYRFADILIDEDQRVVFVEGREVEVQPLVFDLLAYLIRNRDRAVSKQELQDVIWPGMFMSETVLSHTVMKARKTVGDDAQNQSVIKTLHGHGYRFIAQLEADESEAPEFSKPASVVQKSAAPGKRPVLWRVNGTWALVVLALLVAIIYLIDSGFFDQVPKLDRESAEGVSIAVLPFTNLSDDKGSEYFSDGLSEEIMSRLARVSGLLVVARTSAFSFKGSNKDSRTITNELKVSHLIDGSVRKDGDRLRVNAQLIDSGGFQVWSKTYTGVLEDVFSLQDTIANDIVSQVRPSLPVDTLEDPIETVPPTRNLEAYELVLRGNFHLQRRNEGPIKRSIGLFEEAILLDDRYGDAYVGLATAHALLPFYSYETPEESFRSAMATIEKGSQFDPSVPIKASGIKSFILYNSQWSWIDSENGFRQALDYTPDNAEVLQWYSLFLSSTGRFADSLLVAERAQQLDPLSPVVNHRLALAHLWANNDDEALRYFERARELGMPSASIPGAYIILMLRNGEYEKAKQVLGGVQRMLGLGSYWLDSFFAALEDPKLVPAAVAAVEKVAENGDVPRLYIYPIWTYLQQDDRALDAAFDLVQDPPNFNTEFLFSRESAVLRANPRFEQLVQTIGLRRYWEEFEWPDTCQPAGESVVCN
jgi:TolB-like protein/DNA-binding winged helix-turn-helix (wHTH) protein/tetratricopeptide (TPR) repeat protein